MNFGTNDIEQVIWKQIGMCSNFNPGIRGGKNKFVKDLADRMMQFLEERGGDMQKDIKTRARIAGISEEVIDYADRICKVFSFEIVPLTPVAVEVYEWMMEQEVKGQTVEQFAKWAKDPERVKFINKYRNSAGNFKNDWVLAFGETKGTMVSLMETL